MQCSAVQCSALEGIFSSATYICSCFWFFFSTCEYEMQDKVRRIG